MASLVRLEQSLQVDTTANQELEHQKEKNRSGFAGQHRIRLHVRELKASFSLRISTNRTEIFPRQD